MSLSRDFLAFPGFRLVDLETEERSVVLTLEREKREVRCGSCGKEGLPGYDHTMQEARHLLWWQAGSSRPAASRSSGAASKNRACTGASPEPTPSWHFDARSRADATSRSGSAKPVNGPPEWKHAT